MHAPHGGPSKIKQIFPPLEDAKPDTWKKWFLETQFLWRSCLGRPTKYPGEWHWLRLLEGDRIGSRNIAVPHFQRALHAHERPSGLPRAA